MLALKDTAVLRLSRGDPEFRKVGKLKCRAVIAVLVVVRHVLELVSVLHGVATQEGEQVRTGRGYFVHLRLSAFEKTNAVVSAVGVGIAGLLGGSDIDNLNSVELRGFQEVVVVVAVVHRKDPRRSEDTVVAAGPGPRAVIQAAGLQIVVAGQRAQTDIAERNCAGIAENRT